MLKILDKLKDVSFYIFLLPLYVLFTPLVFLLSGILSVFILWGNYLEQGQEL